MKNNKGFTLIELLSVMIILSVILIIAIPRMLDVIESSKLSSFESSARMIISDAEKQYAINKVNGIEDSITCANTSKLNSDEYLNCGLTFDSEGVASINLVGSDKFDGLTCTGDSTTLTCAKNTVTYTDEACFTFNSETGEITGYDNNCEKNVNIPYKIGGELVTSIGTRAFRSDNLTSVTIPNSVTSIGGNAFEGNRLTSLIIPDSVTSIGQSAFYKNNLTSVTIPNSVTSIGGSAFSYNNLASVTISESVTSIGSWAFSNNKLISVTIPENVTSIGIGAFCKSSTYNSDLTTIINKTGRNFNWGNIINASSGYNFATGTVSNSAGNVSVTSE